MTNSPQSSGSTNAFFLQSAISFIVSFAGVAIGIAFLPVDVWVRGFLGLGSLYVVTSTFTLAKCIRDRQEAAILDRVSNPQYYAG